MALRNDNNLIFIFIFVGAMIAAGVGAYALVSWYNGGDVIIGEAVAVVDVVGEIHYSRSKVDEILSYRDDDKIKAVVVFINSPGGGVAASQALYEAVLQVREHKPVVASMGSVAASGGYYVACAADSIMAENGTITGSIGVIASYLRTEELYEKIGLDRTVIKSGRYKDVGSPHRKITEEEKAYLQEVLDSVYDQFLRAVSDGREMPMATVMGLAEGRIYTGEQAQDAGLIDYIGSYQDAVNMAARMGGIEGEPDVVKRRRRRSLAERIFGESVTHALETRHERLKIQYIIP
jgi:protease-4